jgi:D-alanine-D-alanine ligase
MQILVLGGGNSPEREVSLRSAAAVTKALQTAGLTASQADPQDGFSCLDELEKDTIVFPILHGAEGEDGVIQAELEKRQIPYLGTDSIASAICFDKAQAREVLQRAGVPVAAGAEVTDADYSDHPFTKKPHVLKVSRGGSSIGTYIVADTSKIDQAKVAEVFSLDSKAVIEELVEGVEITVPVLDNTALPVIEIRPPENAEFDYENKYNGKTRELCPPESVDEETQKRAKELAEKVHEVLGCRHLSRIDMIVRSNKEMVVLEANTMPGMTDQSLYPKSAAIAGMPMSELVKKFVELVKHDYNL